MLARRGMEAGGIGLVFRSVTTRRAATRRLREVIALAAKIVGELGGVY